MKSDKGIESYKSNDGYILGMPFLRSFIMFMDFDKNEIGFIQKQKNYDAIIDDQLEDKKNEPPKPPVDNTNKPNNG